METIIVRISQEEVYSEVAKATDYTGSKLIDGDQRARDRILAVDEDFMELGRFWDETVLAVNENLKELLVSGETKEKQEASGEDTEAAILSEKADSDDSGKIYEGEIEVSKSFDRVLTKSVETTLRSFFISSIIGQWFKFANKSESSDYFNQAAEFMTAAERLLYSRKKPRIPEG